ncbi:MAG: FimB/Mfa2 family fimbrial subunit [Alistipes sp.]|nr:FimB/Mfa2 family fimbrial subunit [Alistipes sp.]
MKTRSKHITIAALTVLLTWSCIKDNAELSPDIDGSTQVSIDVLVPGTDYGNRTRALTGAGENHVDDITVLVFDGNGGFRYRADARTVQPTGQDNIKRFSVTLKTGQCDIWVLANCKDLIDAYSIPSNATKVSLRQNLLLEINGKWNTSQASFDPLPMWGERTGLNVTPDLSLTGAGNRIPLIRAVAKVDVTIDRAVVPTADFSMQEIRFYHWSNKGQIIPDETVLSSDKTKVTAISGNTAKTPQVQFQAYGTTERDPDGFFTNTIYVPETAAGTQAGSDNPCILINATYKGTPGWYKVEFMDKDISGDTDRYLPLLRNYRYNLEIVRVGGRGYSSAEEAYKSKAQNLIVRIHTHSDASLTNVMYDGQYWLAWDPDRFELDKEEHGMADDYHNLLQIETNCEDGWKLQEIEYPVGQQTDWLSIPSSELAGGKGIRGKVHFVAEENTGSPRSAVVHFSAGRMDMSVKVIQSNENDMEILFFDIDDKPIENIFWVNTVEKKIQERVLRVKWTPVEADLSVTFSAATGDSRDVLYEPGGDIPAGTVDGEGIHEYQLKFSELFNEDAFENPYDYFHYKPYRTKYTFALDYHGKRIEKELVIAHHLQLFELYTFQPEGYLMGLIYWDQSLGFGVSTSFEYELSNNNTGLFSFYSGPRPNWTPGFNPIYNGDVPQGQYIDGYEWVINVKNPTVERRFQYETLTFRFPDSELPDTTLVFKTMNLLPNCYMVAPGNSVHVPVRNPWDARWNGVKPYQRPQLPELPHTGDFTCGLLWEDVDGLIQDVVFTPANTFDPYRTEMTVKTDGSRGEGNAVIALRRNGTIIWSWHVWVTVFDPDAPGANIYTYNDGEPLYFMDRNLGATANVNDTEQNKLKSLGLYYQGGRKDPFPPLGRIPGSLEEAPGLTSHRPVYPDNNIFKVEQFIPGDTERAMLRTIENPTTFITAPQLPHDWYGDNAEDFRWYTAHNGDGSLDPVLIYMKYVYDPCPKGWMVPHSGTKTSRRDWEWGSLDPGNNFIPEFDPGKIPQDFGIITRFNDFYPASGFINHTDGTYREVGFNVLVSENQFVTTEGHLQQSVLEISVNENPQYASRPYATGRNIRCMKIDYLPEND